MIRCWTRQLRELRLVGFQQDKRSLGPMDALKLAGLIFKK